MNPATRAGGAFAAIGLMLILVGLVQSWSLSLAITNLCIISAIMAVGLNIQWGYAGLFNAGVMAFAALGGVAAVLVSHPPVTEAWVAGRLDLLVGFVCVAVTVGVVTALRARLKPGPVRAASTIAAIVAGVLVARHFLSGAASEIEAIDPVASGFLGGLGLPIMFSWLVGGLFAMAVAWLIGRIALGLRADYFAIATLGISEIVIALLKNEDWLTRGVKNVSGLQRPVPYEIDLQHADWFIALVRRLNAGTLAEITEAGEYQAALAQLTIEASSVFVKACYLGLFLAVLLVVLALASRALNSPWGRMMRAIRDNEEAAGAMGKNVTMRHRQVFIFGSAIIGVAGAMLTTLDGQFTPGTYNPLRFTFLIWVMVIVGGSGNNLGAIFGGFLVWFVWIEAEPVSLWAVENMTAWMADNSIVRAHLVAAAPHMRLFLMGLVLLLVLRFSPRGVLPEYVRHPGRRA